MRNVFLITYSAITLLSFSLLLWIIPAQTPPSIGIGIPPSVLPNALAGIMLACSASLLLKTFLTTRETSKNPLPLPVWVHIAKYSAVCFLAFPLMSYIGFIAGSMFVLAMFQFLTGQRNIVIIIGVSASVSVLAYLGAVYGMGISLDIAPVFDF